jgi:hypothetical protein
MAPDCVSLLAAVEVLNDPILITGMGPGPASTDQLQHLAGSWAIYLSQSEQYQAS